MFFTGCTLKCGFCQNCQISRQGLGLEVSSSELQRLMLRLQEWGADNINLVTASHFAPSIIESVAAARKQGLSIPVVWNSSGYEQISTLQLLRQTVDIYLPDCKTLDPALSRRLMGAGDYPNVVQQVLLKMTEDRTLVVEEEQVRQGVILRHLVLPGLLPQSREVLEWFANHLMGRAILSLMFQYTPRPSGMGKAGIQGNCSAKHAVSVQPYIVQENTGVIAGNRNLQQSLQRSVSRREYENVLSWLEELGIDDGFLQEPARSDDWLPDFTRPNPFPQGQAVPIWYFESGYLNS